MRANPKVYLVSAVLSVLFDPALALAQATAPASYWEWRDSMGPWHMWGGWGHWWIFPLLMMVFMIVACAFFMSRMLSGHGQARDDHTASALRLLNERFAKGEISKEEFEEKRTILVRHS
jgi:putative membrane protein